MSQVINIFSTPIFHTKLNTMCDDRIKMTLDLVSNYDYSGREPATHSSIFHHPHLLDVKREIQDLVLGFGKNVFNHLIDGIEITNSWSNNMFNGKSIDTHFHANSYISGSVYLSHGTPITFYDSNELFCIQPKSIENEYKISPSPGDIVLFPSKLKHGVHQEENAPTRYSIAFNTFPTRNIDGVNSVDSFVKDPYFL